MADAYFVDKNTQHNGIVIVKEYTTIIRCIDCTVESKGNTESNAKKTFTKKHKG